MKQLTHSQRAERYAKAVVSGKIPAAKPVRLACQRHLDDLKRAKSKAFPFRFDIEAAEKVCKFIELLPHVKGRWARNHEKIRLEDWQCFITCVVFGWLRKADGLRRFRRVYIEVPRKNGKSSYTAAIGLYMLTAEGEVGAEVYSGAGSEKQSWEVFGPARLMAQQTPDFLAAYGVEVGARNISVPGRASKFEAIIGKPGDGASPSMAVHDEYHEHPTEEQYDTMLTGMGAREQPLSWVITTAGSDTAGPCYALRTEVMEVLEGTVENEQLFGIIYTIDLPRKELRNGVEVEVPGDDWTSEEALRKANPNYDVSVTGEFLKTQIRDAINNPRKQATTKTKHLCVWVTAAAPYLNLEKWKLNGGARIEEFEGEPCWMGIDLASKLDLCASIKVFKREVAMTEHFYAFGRFYVPEERANEADKRHYAGWIEDGYLISTGEQITDYDRIEADILEDAERFRIVQLGADPYNATQILTHLSSAGIDVVEVPQTVAHLSEPMKMLQALIEANRMHHDGNLCFSWQIGNLTGKVDRNENVFPRKEQPEKKIDGDVALIIALGRAMLAEDSTSVYETRGLLTV